MAITTIWHITHIIIWALGYDIRGVIYKYNANTYTWTDANCYNYYSSISWTLNILTVNSQSTGVPSPFLYAGTLLSFTDVTSSASTVIMNLGAYVL